jgi:hypothetical protein
MAISFEPDATTLSDEFHHRITAGRGRVRAGVVGVEHEYVVRRAGEQVDFARLIGELPIDGRALHPTNRHAYFLRTGAVVMADGKVAEIATPPVRAGPGAATAVDAWATATESELRAAVGPEHSVSGGSTHISVQADPDVADRLALVYARTFAAPMMLMIDRHDSPGLLVRPRPGRHEMCGEYVSGDALRAAVAFALATTGALQRVLTTGAALPPLLDVVLEPGRRRYGWYVDRRAFGVDLYQRGREARLPLASGGTVAAGDYLREAWRFARSDARDLLSPDEYRLVDDVVAGRLPIPLEGDHPEAGAARVTPGRTPLGRGLDARRRGELAVEPVSATWDWMAFQVASNGDRAVALVPRSDLDEFLDQFDAGTLDEVLRGYLARAGAAGHRDLHFHAQTGAPGLHDSISPGPAILPTDRFGVGAGPASRQRPGKRLPPSPEPAPAPGTKGNDSNAVTVLGLVIVLLAMAIGVMGLARTSHAVATEELDPRLVIDEVDGVVDESGELWLRICFAEPWAGEPPRDLFSAFFGFINLTGDQETVVGWERHDGIETPLFETEQRPDLAAFVLDDGKVVIATGLFPDGEFVELVYQTASWADEDEGGGAREDGFDSLGGSDIGTGDPMTVWGTPVFDLTTGTPITATPPTTTTTTTTTTTLPPVAPPTTAAPATTLLETAAPTTVAAPTTAAAAPSTIAAGPSTTAPASTPTGTSGDGGRNWLWLLPVLFGLLLIGGGWYVLRTDPGTSPPSAPGTTPGSTPIWLEKGNVDQQTRPRVMR